MIQEANCEQRAQGGCVEHSTEDPFKASNQEAFRVAPPPRKAYSLRG